MNQVFESSLELMWKGMLSIFVVIGVIFVVILIMNRIAARKKKNGAGNEGA